MSANRPPSPPAIDDILALGGAEKGKVTAAQRTAAARLYTFLQSLGREQVVRAQAVENEKISQIEQYRPGAATSFIGAFGVQTVPRLGSAVAVGMAVRVRDQIVTAASITDITTAGPANAVVMAVTDTEITIALGAASGPLRVMNPEIGGRVFLLANGGGTCDIADTGNVLTQVYATCASTRRDANNCVRCMGISFGGGQVEWADQDGYLRRNVDNEILASPPNANTVFNGSGNNYVLTINNTSTGSVNPGGALFLSSTATGSGVVLNVNSVVGKGGASFTSENAGAVGAENDATLAHALTALNRDTSGFHAFFGTGSGSGNDAVEIVHNSIVLYGLQGAGVDTITLSGVAGGVWGVHTQTFQAASGTIALEAVATQTITAATNTIISSARTVVVTNTTSNFTMSSTPTIVAGVHDGQMLTIINSKSSTSRFVLQGEVGLAGSGMYLGAAGQTLNNGGTIELVWIAAVSKWYEKSFVTATA